MTTVAPCGRSAPAKHKYCSLHRCYFRRDQRDENVVDSPHSYDRPLLAGNAAATPLSASEKADFVSSGVPACIASGEKAQVKTVNWPVYCNCIMGKMSDDITKEDVMAIWVASEGSRHSVGSAIFSNWLRTHESAVRACLKSSIWGVPEQY